MHLPSAHSHRKKLIHAFNSRLANAMRGQTVPDQGNQAASANRPLARIPGLRRSPEIRMKSLSLTHARDLGAVQLRKVGLLDGHYITALKKVQVKRLHEVIKALSVPSKQLLR